MMESLVKEHVYIVGAGSIGGHIAANFTAYRKDARCMGFLDDDPQTVGETAYGYPVLGGVDRLLDVERASVVIAISSPVQKRRVLHKLLSNKSLLFPPFVHGAAWISSGVTLERGCIVYPGAAINYGAVIGEFSVINMNCALGHHTRLGAFSSLAPGVMTGGHTDIGKDVIMGISAATAQSVRIGDGAVIGGQSMIIHDVEEGAKMVGVPARVVQ
jgi:sugar O-acyltransferase (sialic acid O-acetyltransferase NeuD family)